jgi:hypothetical protein
MLAVTGHGFARDTFTTRFSNRAQGRLKDLGETMTTLLLMACKDAGLLCAFIQPLPRHREQREAIQPWINNQQNAVFFLDCRAVCDGSQRRWLEVRANSFHPPPSAMVYNRNTARHHQKKHMTRTPPATITHGV